ncbi:MAG: AAA family ATPase [Planctomycetes bacterium]|nr:AAA family ATPase [Planctomycetota bacterium]
MEIERLIADLSRPEVYPQAAEGVKVVQTHISVVFLAGGFVYKIKKPVNFGFLDFSTLEKRKHFCEEEVRLNRRLAPDVYLDAVPVTLGRSGPTFRKVKGETIEYAVKMKRLPDEWNFHSMLERKDLTADHLDLLAERLGEFYKGAETSEYISSFGSPAAVKKNMKANLRECRRLIGMTITKELYEKLALKLDAKLSDATALLLERQKAHRIRSAHGDLRLDHVYLDPKTKKITIIDCIEFNEQFRYIDQISDVSFLLMELAFYGRTDLARHLVEKYAIECEDWRAYKSLAIYYSHKHIVRGKVRSLEAQETEVTGSARNVARRKATAHFLCALQALEEEGERQKLLLVGGLPGTGKSTVSKLLEKNFGFVRFSSDETRKKLAGIPAKKRAKSEFREGIYTDDFSARTYEALLGYARDSLLKGEKVVVDASFCRRKERAKFSKLAKELHVPFEFAVCDCDRVVVRDRLEKRRNDPSDAGFEVYIEMEKRFDKPPKDSAKIDTNLPRKKLLECVRELL